jgi:hypothetical protein
MEGRFLQLSEDASLELSADGKQVILVSPPVDAQGPSRAAAERFAIGIDDLIAAIRMHGRSN